MKSLSTIDSDELQRRDAQRRQEQADASTPTAAFSNWLQFFLAPQPWGRLDVTYGEFPASFRAVMRTKRGVLCSTISPFN